jgi:thiol:disulfide interchange protein
MTGLPSQLHRALTLLAFLFAITSATFITPSAQAADIELPPVDQVFVLSAKATAQDRIEVHWKIATGYYLYRHRTSVKAAPGFTDGVLSLPDGSKHHDEFFGDVETYRQQLTGVFTGTPQTGSRSVKLTVKYQGCADVGVCYPPQTRTLAVTLPASESTPASGFSLGRKASGIFGFANDAQAGIDAAPLPPEQAFQSDVIALDGNTLLLRLTPATGYYLYRDKLSVNLEAGSGVTAQLPPANKRPKAQPYHDEHFGDVAVYFDQVEIPISITRQRTDAVQGTLAVGLQGCQDNGICYPPMTHRLPISIPVGTLDAPLPTEPTASADASPAMDAAVNDATTPSVTTATNPTTDTPTNTPAELAGTAIASGETTSAPSPPTLLPALLLALLGGLILNLMPCVLPVLSLKALGLAQSGESRKQARHHALAYTAGVLLSMLALGALVLLLRRAGLAFGWGFQLQQPLVLAVLALVMFALGLSLSGLWQANLRLGSHGSALLQGTSRRADFFTGVLAVVLATPCTAPFMGAALAYAFTGPAIGALLVFLMLGLGLALPFLLIGFMPALASRLPKPGAWMDTFKQLLAFPLYLTAAWLVWVLTTLRGADATGLWLLAAILLGFAAWAWARRAIGKRPVWSTLALAALLVMLWPLAKLHALPKPSMTPNKTTSHGVVHVPWSERALADLRTQQRPIFVNMTADWCVTCKANEKTVLARAGFRDAIEAANAVYMVGDYTDVDPAITAYLQQHKAVGVPLYVVYPRDGGAPRILPTLLTPTLVAEALTEAAR